MKINNVFTIFSCAATPKTFADDIYHTLGTTTAYRAIGTYDSFEEALDALFNCLKNELSKHYVKENIIDELLQNNKYRNIYAKFLKKDINVKKNDLAFSLFKPYPVMVKRRLCGFVLKLKSGLIIKYFLRCDNYELLWEKIQESEMINTKLTL